MQRGVAVGVEDGQQDKTGGADNGEDNRQAEQDLLADGDVGDQTAAVSQPALRDKGQVQEDGDDAGAGDEERLELLGADVADVRDVLAGVHGRVVRAVRVDDPVQQEPKQHAEPDEARDDWEHLAEG